MKTNKQKKLPSVGLYKFTSGKIEEGRKMPIRMRLLWLEESNRFIHKRYGDAGISKLHSTVSTSKKRTESLSE